MPGKSAHAKTHCDDATLARVATMPPRAQISAAGRQAVAAAAAAAMAPIPSLEADGEEESDIADEDEDEDEEGASDQEPRDRSE